MRRPKIPGWHFVKVSAVEGRRLFQDAYDLRALARFCQAPVRLEGLRVLSYSWAPRDLRYLFSGDIKAVLRYMIELQGHYTAYSNDRRGLRSPLFTAQASVVSELTQREKKHYLREICCALSESGARALKIWVSAEYAAECQKLITAYRRDIPPGESRTQTGNYRSEIALKFNTDDVLASIERACGVTRTDLLSPSRHRKTTRARALAYEQLRRRGMTLDQIGTIFRRNPSSVHQLLKRSCALPESGDGDPPV